MVLDKYEKKYKEFLKAEKRLHEIQKELRNIPLVPLKVPFQKGWEVTIKLRDDIARRSDANVINTLLFLGYDKGYITKSLNDVKAIRKGQKSIPYIDAKGRKCSRSLIPSKKRVSEDRYNEFPNSMQKYFDYDRISLLFKTYGRKIYEVYLPDYWLVLKVRPYIVTHQRIKGGELETEEKKLKSFLEEYWREWFGNSGRSWLPRWRDERPSLKASIKKFLKGEIEDLSL
jgi:hypothetical protein